MQAPHTFSVSCGHLISRLLRTIYVLAAIDQVITTLFEDPALRMIDAYFVADIRPETWFSRYAACMFPYFIFQTRSLPSIFGDSSNFVAYVRAEFQYLQI